LLLTANTIIHTN